MSFSIAESKDDINSLPLFVAKYTFKGEFVSFSPLTDELTLCPFSSEDVQKVKQFGFHFKKKCEVDIEQLFSSKDELYFYEIYIRSSDNQEFTDVPIGITNYLQCTFKI